MGTWVKAAWETEFVDITRAEASSEASHTNSGKKGTKPKHGVSAFIRYLWLTLLVANRHAHTGEPQTTAGPSPELLLRMLRWASSSHNKALLLDLLIKIAVV